MDAAVTAADNALKGTLRTLSAVKVPLRTHTRTPTVMQMEVVECGAASLAMILGYYQRYVPLEELRVVCGVSRDGSKASNVLKAARGFGLEAKGMQMEVAELKKLTPPAIVFWKFNHFLVYEGMGRRFGKPVVHLNDPAQGRRTIPESEFDECFTGVVLTMRPGPDFRTGGSRPGLFSGLRQRLHGGSLVLGLLASVLLAVVAAMSPALTTAFIDTILLGHDTSILLPFFALLGAVTLVTAALTAVQQGHLLQARIVSATLTSARFLKHLLRLPISFFSQRGPAEVTRRLQSNDVVADMLTRDVTSVVIDSLVVVLYAGLLWAYNAQLTIVGLHVAVLNVIALRVVAKLRAGGAQKLATDRAILMNTSYHGLRNIETMKATAGEDEYFRRWASLHATVLSGQQTLGLPSAVLAIVAPVLAALNSALILLIGGMHAVDGHISIGLLVAFQTLVTAFTRPVTQLAGMAGRVQDVAVDIARLRDVENFPVPASVTVDEPDRVSRLTGHLRLDGVEFGYNPLSTPLITDFGLAAGPGQIVALVGGSGSGKSTVSRLISGLYQPWSGTIRFDGAAREEIPRSVLAASVTFVDQDIFLFEGTVRDNVTLWDPCIPDEAVVSALMDAAVYDAVSSRPGGIHSIVEEDGRNFSGGQRQRLELARALVRDPSVLVLDEATSALDAETESVVVANVRRRGCACVVIAHRLSTIRDADEIIVLDHGKVVERGTHQSLVAAGGRYTELVRES